MVWIGICFICTSNPLEWLHCGNAAILASDGIGVCVPNWSDYLCFSEAEAL